MILRGKSFRFIIQYVIFEKVTPRMVLDSKKIRIIILLIILQALICFVNPTIAQTKNGFTNTDQFEIPENNGVIRFNINGTYDLVSLENSIWIFENLHFDNSQREDNLNLTVSAKDCELIINSYFLYNRTYDGETFRRARLTYSTIGDGSQLFNLGLDPKMGNLDVRLNGEWVGRNHGWTLSSDGTLNISGANSSVIISYYGFPDSFRDNSDFFRKHSIVVVSSLFVGITVFFAFFLKKRKDET